jgi:dienelactone hydrolase
VIRSQIRYKDGNTQLTGVLVVDEALQDRRPGILVIHGGAGLDDHAEGRAHRLAELGYVVFACDMYGDGVAGIDVLVSHSQVDGRVAAVGYCFGGMTVLELARGGVDLAGAVCVHGSLWTNQPAQPDSVKPRILVCHGALDPHGPPAHVVAFIEEMNHASADWQLIVYGGAMHGFTHETATGQTPGVMYHAPSDARSSVAIQRFLEELFSVHDS